MQHSRMRRQTQWNQYIGKYWQIVAHRKGRQQGIKVCEQQDTAIVRRIQQQRATEVHMVCLWSGACK